MSSTTIVDYMLDKAGISFEKAPLNEVDSLVLSSLAYFQFEHGTLSHLDEKDAFVKLPLAICGISRDMLFGNTWLASFDGDALLCAVLASSRFMSLSAGLYVNDIDASCDKQFSAITFMLPDKTVYVAFRGTDNTLAGWKEDFNLSFMDCTPSQLNARTYLEHVASLDVERIYVGGHSKGGNLAEYAALACDDATYRKLVRVYNHDGPSFCTSVSQRMDDPGFRAILSKTVPHDSIFGMLMEHREDFDVVQARSIMFAQHAPTNWIVSGQGFAREDALSPYARVLGDTLTTWGLSYPPAKRQLFVDTLFEVLASAGITNWAQIKDDQGVYARALIEAASHVEPDVRTQLLGMVSDIFSVLRTTAQVSREDGARDEDDASSS